MVANELRVVVNGLYYWQGIPIKMDLNTIGKFEKGFKSYDDLQPIQLTEEILLKCGLEKIHKFGYYITDNTHVVFTLGYGNTLDATIDSDSILNENIKYLHQLQNLYFALTNEELTINL